MRRRGREGVACLATTTKNIVGGPPKRHISNRGKRIKRETRSKAGPMPDQCLRRRTHIKPTQADAFTHGPERKHTHICLYMYVQSEIYLNN